LELQSGLSYFVVPKIARKEKETAKTGLVNGAGTNLLLVRRIIL